MTIISSSNRIIKKPDTGHVVERYIPPLEVTLKNPENAAKKPVFPRYSKDGVLKPDSQPVKEKPESFSPEKDPLREDEAQRRQLNEEAQKALEEARETAKAILEEAREQAEKEFEEARKEGWRKGYEEGYREGKERGEAECAAAFRENMDAFQADMKQALRSVETAKENCVRTYLDELKDCAIAIGEKVIHISLRSSGEVIKQMIISATEKLKKTAWVKIYMDKCDYDMMMQADADILDELSHLSDNIKFIVMDKEERGNCIIEMPEEIIDVSVNTQIENIKDILENVRI